MLELSRYADASLFDAADAAFIYATLRRQRQMRCCHGAADDISRRYADRHASYAYAAADDAVAAALPLSPPLLQADAAMMLMPAISPRHDADAFTRAITIAI